MRHAAWLGALVLVLGWNLAAEEGTPSVFHSSLRFDAKGTLYLTDARSNHILAVAFPEKKQRMRPIAAHDLGPRIAAALGCQPKDVRVQAMAIHPRSHAAYLSVEAAESGATRLFRVSPDGKAEPITLDQRPSTSVRLPRGLQPLDIAITSRGLVVSSMARDSTFSSFLHWLPLPLTAHEEIPKTQCEVFHVSHAAWETNAPLVAMTSCTIGKQEFILGSTACTPVVRIPVEDIVRGGKVRTTTVAELGVMNSPLCLRTYKKKKGQVSLLVTSTKKETYRLDGIVLSQGERINERALNRNTGGGNGVEILKHLSAASKVEVLGSRKKDSALVVLTMENGVAALKTVKLP